MTDSATGRWRPRIAVVTGPTATIVNTPPRGADPAALVPQRLAADTIAEVVGGSGHPGDDAGENAAVRMGAGDLHLAPHVGPAPTATFFPDAERLFEEIDRFGVGDDGRANLLGDRADFVFERAGAPGGLPGEVRGRDFFAYGDDAVRAEPDFAALLRITNAVQRIARSDVDAVHWLEGTPVVEETLYWLGLLVDTTKPIVGAVAQRLHRTVSADGPRNILDGVEYVISRAWADDDRVAHDVIGPVLVVDGLVYTAREVEKVAARPGGYAAGVFGPIATVDGLARLGVLFRPTRRTTARSHVRTSELPATTRGLRGEVAIRTADGELSDAVRATVDIVKYGRYGWTSDSDAESLRARAEVIRRDADLGGFVVEGLAQNGWSTATMERALREIHDSGMPVVWTGRGVPHGVAGLPPVPFVSAAGLSATKARMLLLAALLRFGAAPAAADPAHPTAEELRATAAHTARLQQLFDSH